MNADNAPDWLVPPTEGRNDLARIISIGLIVIAVFFGGFVGWATLAPLASAVIAPGALTIETQRKTVQHLEGGIIKDILVGEGSVVEQGQVLFRMDEVRAQARFAQLQAAYRSLQGRSARLAAERDGLEEIPFPDELLKDIDDNQVKVTLASQRDLFVARRNSHAERAAILDQQVSQLNEEITGLAKQIDSQHEQSRLVGEEITTVKKLLAKQLVERSRLLRLQQRQSELEGDIAINVASIARAQQKIGELTVRISEMDAERVNDAANRLQEVDGQLLEIREQLMAAEDSLLRTEVIAPVSGRVVELRVHTAGGVVAPGDPLLDIVPSDERLIVDARINTDDIEHVTQGMDARVRITAFSQRHFQPLAGRMISVSADSLTDERTGEAYYLGRIEILDDPAEMLDGAELQPGMRAQAYIQTGTTTLFGYLAKPIVETMDRALRES